MMAEKLNSVERTLRTISFQPVDRVPVDLHNFLVTARLMGVNLMLTFSAMARPWRRVKLWPGRNTDMMFF